VADVEFDSIKRKFRSGDFIIMITDGVLDANKKIEDKERWLADLIENIVTPNPQEMAERILYNVLEEAELDFPEDDMTVLVSRLWESK
jgi:stage II sporulation protein E